MTPDQDLSARLLPCPFCGGEAGSCLDPNHSTGWEVGCFSGNCDIEPHVWAVHHATAIDQWNRRYGQLITLADHERAVQAAVAKAVEALVNAENEACAKMLDNEADDYEADASRFRGGTDPHHYRMNLASTARKYAAAIRSRGVAG